MTNEEMKALREGDIIRGRLSGRAYIVVGNYGDHVTAVDTADVTHAEEWDVVRKCGPGPETHAIPLTSLN